MIPTLFFLQIRLGKLNRHRKEALVEENDVVSDKYIDGNRVAEAVMTVG